MKMGTENGQFNSRYTQKKYVGQYHPWQGFTVVDSLSEKGYLLFALSPASVPLCLEDLKMRDYLFSRASEVPMQALSIQRHDAGITFLMPHTPFVPLTKALPSMKSRTALKYLRELSRGVIACLRSGLFFHNLAPKSIVMADGKVRILPTAYLLPGDVISRIARIEAANHAKPRDRSPLVRDLRDLGAVFETFGRYLEAPSSARCKEIGRRLRELNRDTARESLLRSLGELASFVGLDEPLFAEDQEPLIETPPPMPNTLRIAAAGARTAGRQLVIVEGTDGPEKTQFLREAARVLTDECGLSAGVLLGDQELFQNVGEESAPLETDFFMIDDHAQDAVLSGFIVERCSRAFEECALGLIVFGDTTPRILREAIDELKRSLELCVHTVTLPPRDPAERGALPDRWGDLLSRLSPEERSVLTFIAAFRFEIPLALIRHVYAAEEEAIYATLQSLLSRGLVRARAERSALAGDDLCLVYGVAGRRLAATVLDAVAPERRAQMHDNIVLLLREIDGIPQPLLYYHLVRAGRMNEAAMKGFELFHVLLKRRNLSAINCFNESFLEEKLDEALPPEIRFKMLLELGNFFSLIGNMEKAESLYRLCREETHRRSGEQTYRALSVEAVRRECEILEKKGEFLRALKLLEEALDSHGEFILATDRSKLYNDLAWIHYRLGQFDSSWNTCLIVHKLLEEKQNPHEVSQTYNMMGAIHWNRSDYEDAILCYQKCLSLREDCNDEIGVAASYNNLGLVYRDMGKVRQALECFTKSMELKQRNNNLPGLAAVHLNIALAYLDLENVDEAEKNCLMASRLAEDIGNQQLLAECFGTLGEIKFLLGSLESARDYYYQDLHICEKTRSLREKVVVFRRLAELNLKEGKTPESRELLSRARALNRKIGSRLETTLLNVLEGRILLAEGKRELGKRMLEAGSVELSLLGRKCTAASVAALIGELSLEEGNEQLAREYLLRATSLVGEDETMPSQITRFREKLDRRQPLSLSQIQTDADRFRALCRVTSLMRTTHDPAMLYRAITETALTITGMKRVILALQSNGDETYRILAGAGGFESFGTIGDADILAVLNITRHLGYPLDVSRTKIPEGRVSDAFLGRHRGIICIPLWIRDDVTGFLYLDSTESSTIASDDDHSLLLAFSQQAALALQTIILAQRIDTLGESKPRPQKVSLRAKERLFLQDIVAESPAMRNILELVEGIKDMDTTVLLTGENGTGKDMIAKVIHYSSLRSEKPFVSLNTAAFPGELLESELFGHEKGSFTGAVRQKIGHFEAAAGGTILLNEIGDMTLKLQPKLLRVLEEQKFYRVGGTREISTNVRIITATNKELLDLVKQEAFREDLYYRINIFPIRIPPLRQRKDDIEPLCERFLTTYCQLYNITRKHLSPEAIEYLLTYDWPGNVRELEHLVNRLIIISKKDTILPEDLPDYIVKHKESFRENTRISLEETIEQLLENTPFSKSDPLLPKVEGVLIKKVVDRTGDKTKAAGLLGISKPTLYSKLRKP